MRRRSTCRSFSRGCSVVGVRRTCLVVGGPFGAGVNGCGKCGPLAPLIDEVHEVVFVDGIHLGRKAVVLIACSEEHVLGWYVARSENSRAWAALMDRIAPPELVVTDGGSGFEKARKNVWPQTRVVVHLPCVRADHAGDDDPPEASRVQGAVRPGQAAHSYLRSGAS